jgi:hypothetical protein
MKMSKQNWQTIKIKRCERVHQDVGLEANMVFAEGILEDQPARISAHRCSYGIDCNLEEKAGCTWAGTNPAYDPFLETTEE